MSVIEQLRQTLEGELQVKQQREESLRLVREVAATKYLQNEAKERERHAQRKAQAKAYEQESGMGLLLDKLMPIVKMDLSKQSPKGIQRILPITSHGSIDQVSNYDSEEIISLKTAIKPCDPDSIYEVIRWDDGQVKVAADYSSLQAIRSGQGINRILHHYRKFVGIEITPEGDIVFHSRSRFGMNSRNSIPKSAWKDNKEVLEAALIKLYHSRPSTYIFEEQYWTHGPQVH